MSSLDKIAICWTIVIISISLGVTFFLQTNQHLGETYEIKATNVSQNSELSDPLGDTELLDFDIKNFGLNSEGEGFITVYGKPGGTLPDGHMDVYAYVIIAENGIFASDSHEASHMDDENVSDKAWHGHKVTIEKNGGPNGKDCVTEIGSFFSKSRFEGDTLVISNINSDVRQALTVKLELLTDNPDNVEEGECVAEIKEIFDSAGN